jgi:hypothetical protein
MHRDCASNDLFDRVALVTKHGMGAPLKTSIEQFASVTAAGTKVAVSRKHRHKIQVTAQIEFHATDAFDPRPFRQGNFAPAKVVAIFGFDIRETLLIKTPRRFPGSKPRNYKDSVLRRLGNRARVRNVNCVLLAARSVGRNDVRFFKFLCANRSEACRQ